MNRHRNFTIEEPEEGWCQDFDANYAELLRPMAETLAMMDGNAFFTFDDHWRNYLPEADAVFRSNGGIDGWAGQCSWIQDLRLIQKDPTLRDARDKLKVLMALKRNKNGPV